VSAAPVTPGVVPEKRKRGRPRKVNLQPAFPIIPADISIPGVTRPTESGTESASVAQQDQARPAQPSQYLLAVFAFFSFFNSPLATSSSSSYTQSHHHTHSGAVLTHADTAYPPPPVAGAHGYGWGELMQGFHILVSVLLFVSIVVPWLPKMLRIRCLSSLVPLTSALRATDSRSTSKVSAPASADAFNRVALIDALSPSCRGSVDEAARLRAALGVHAGILGLLECLVKGGKRSGSGIERMQLEQRAWVRLGELAALNGKQTSFSCVLPLCYARIFSSSLLCAVCSHVWFPM
jgi:hypothetical protein